LTESPDFGSEKRKTGEESAALCSDGVLLLPAEMRLPLSQVSLPLIGKLIPIRKPMFPCGLGPKKSSLPRKGCRLAAAP
jgi:hypothetical protein